MARPLRRVTSECAYHVINRGNGGGPIFHKDSDYQAFLDLLAATKNRIRVKLFAFCLMPNHFHVVLQPDADADLSRFMHLWETKHARRYHLHYRSHGHLWQGRFKSFPIQQDGHFLTVVRYVLHNPVRAGLVGHPDHWPWSSPRHLALLDPWPVPPPGDWNRWLEDPLSDHELIRLRMCVNRQAPFGMPAWQELMAWMLGLISTLRPRGRPPNRASR